MHILNAAYALFEIFFTNTPVLPWLLLVPGIVMLGGYLGVAYITHITQGLYRTRSMQWRVVVCSFSC